jgi:hypothetical protein
MGYPVGQHEIKVKLGVAGCTFQYTLNAWTKGKLIDTCQQVVPVGGNDLFCPYILFTKLVLNDDVPEQVQSSQGAGALRH